MLKYVQTPSLNRGASGCCCRFQTQRGVGKALPLTNRMNNKATVGLNKANRALLPTTSAMRRHGVQATPLRSKT
jgi:hypothetical protein